MERFAINILHKQIYKICRLCGVDQPSKVPILEETDIEIIVGDEEEATLAKKILDCVGIEVSKDDKMPQNICSLCVDKISDFYEYRLMCAATNLQTRTILNLPLVEPSRKQLGIAAKADVKDVKEDVKIEAASSSSSKKGKKRRGPPSPSPSPSPAPTTRVKAPIDVKDEPVPSTPVKALTKKERLKQLQQQQLLAQQKLEKDKESEAELKQTRSKRKEPSPDEAEPSSSKQQTAKSELTVPVPKKIKFEHPCSFCSDEFKTQTELDSHLGLKHVPTVRKFGCGSCRETFESVLEFKDHNLWHQLTRTPYTCFKCKRKWDKNAALVKHASLNACGRISRGRPPAILPDVQCRLCNRKFKTQNLFEWHSCFLKPKSKCPKCDKYFVKKQILTRHYMMFCTGTLPPPEPLLIPKDEPVEQPAAVNSKSGAAAVPGTAAGTAERRTRRSLPAEPELPKEEREIPFPPPLELEPEAPAPTPSSSARKRGRPKNAPPSVETPAPAAAPADAAADKIATLLDTGSKLDKDTDIATINNLLSSVTEAIASISEAKAKKKKKKKDKTKDRVRNVDTPTAENSSSPVDTRTEEERKADEFAEQAAQLSMDEQLALCKMPMVVLAKTTFKQETTEIDTEPSQLQEPLGNGDDDDDDNYEESGNDYGGFQDEDDEEAAAPPPAATPAAPAAEEIPFPMPIKQEEEDTPAESESQPADKEAPPPPQDTTFNEQLALNIKREPGLEEASDPPAAKKRRPESRTSVASPASTLSSSSGPARGSPKPTLILKIKKEKGLLNATVSEPISVDDDEGDDLEERSQSRARKSVYKKPNILAVRIKQEKVDPAYERQEVIAAQSSELPGGIRIKQERIDPEELESSSSPIEAQDLGEAPARKKPRQTREPSPVIAFDGVRIKQEKPDRPVEPATKSATPSPSPDATPKPTEKKKKSKVKINPFALLKQRMAAEAAAKSASEPPQSASPLPVITNVVGNAAASTASSSTRSSISGDAEPAPEQPVPVIAQVQSIAKDAAVEDDFPMPIKEEPTEESSTAADDKKMADGGDEEEEQDEFPMPIKEEAPEETPPAESADDAEEDEFPMPIKEEPEESLNGVVEQPSAVEEEEKSKDDPEQAEEPAAKEKDDENDEEPDSSPEKVEESATEEIDEKEDEDAKSSPEEADEPEAKDASPEEPEEEESTPEEPEVEESSPKKNQEEPKSPEEQKTEEPEDEEKSPEENQDEQESAEEQNPQECSEPSPAEPAPAEETKEDEVESTPEDTNGEEQDQPAEPEVAPAKPDEPLEHIPEESTSPISDTPMDEYEQNSQEQPEPAPEKSDEPPKPAPESDFEELQNLLTEGLRPPDLDCSTSVTEAGTQPPETGGLDVDLDSLLNNKLDEISGGAPQQPDDLQLAIERELLNEMMPPAPMAAAEANEGAGNGQEQSL